MITFEECLQAIAKAHHDEFIREAEAHNQANK
jgi:hypothetical protein